MEEIKKFVINFFENIFGISIPTKQKFEKIMRLLAGEQQYEICPVINRTPWKRQKAVREIWQIFFSKKTMSTEMYSYWPLSIGANEEYLNFFLETGQKPWTPGIMEKSFPVNWKTFKCVYCGATEKAPAGFNPVCGYCLSASGCAWAMEEISEDNGFWACEGPEFRQCTHCRVTGTERCMWQQ